MSEQKKPVEKKNPLDLRVKLLTIACGVLLLALIVVSAFAYEWHSTIDDYKNQIVSLRAISDTSTITSMSEEISNLTIEVNTLTMTNETLNEKIESYEAILTENGLMPE